MKSGRYDVLFDRANPTMEELASTGTRPLLLRIRTEGKPQERYLQVSVRIYEQQPVGHTSVRITGALIIHTADRGTVSISYNLESKTGTFIFAE